MMFKIFLLVCLLSQRNACCRKRPKRLVILEMSSSSSPPPRVVLVLVLVIIIVIVISFHGNRRARPPRLARLVFLLLPPWPVTFSALAAGFFPFTIGFSYSNCLRLHALAMGNIFFRAFSMGYAQPPLPSISRSSKPSLRATAFTPFAFGDIFCNAYHGWHRFPRLPWCYLFARLPLVTTFRALATGYIPYRGWHLFPRLPRVTSFPALTTGDIFFFPRLPRVTTFPALSNGYMFSRACQWLYVFPRLPRVTCFPLCNTFSHVYDW